MENKGGTGLSKKHDLPTEPLWLYLLIQDSLIEAGDAAVIGERMLGEIGRAVVWTMSLKFGCDHIGVPGQACRVFERYLASLTRQGIVGVDRTSQFNYLAPRLIVTLACCFEIATKTINTTVRVGPKEIQTYLASCGNEFTIREIIDTETEIFRGIGLHVPLYNSVEMAELLAVYFGVEQSEMELVNLFVQLAELRRHNIENEVRCVAGLKHLPYGYPRVRTLHLAAGCVAAAVKVGSLSARNHIAVRLARLIRVSSTFIKVLRDVIIVWIRNPRRA